MKSSPLIAALVLASCLCVRQLAWSQEESIDWSTDLNAAKQLAAAENKLVLVHFWGTFCRPCLNLDKFVFTNPHVAAAIGEHFVPVKVDVEAQPGLAKQFGITTIPHDVVITPDGQIIAKQASSQNSDNYLRMVENVAKKAARTNPLTLSAVQQIARSEPDPSLINKAYVPAGQTSVTPEPIRVIGNSAPVDESAVQTVGGQMMLPIAKDERKFAAAKDPSNSTVNSVPAVARKINPIGGDQGVQPQATQAGKATQLPGLSIQSLRPLLGEPDSAPTTQTNDAGAPQPAPKNSPLAIKVPARPASSSTKVPITELPLVPPVDGGQAAAPPTSTLSATNHLKKPLGFGGFCPVTWFATGQLVTGQSRWGCEHRGRVYFFASPQLRDQFLLAPDVLSPRLAGYDPVTYTNEGTLVDGSLQHMAVVESGSAKSVYMFASAENKAAFDRDSQKFISEVREAMRTADAQ